MSGTNGDKARFFRERKKKVVRQKRTRDLRKSLVPENKENQAAVGDSKQ